MGCTQSKIENEEAVSRCKERKVFMKDAVSSRNAFAAAHSSYTISLKNTGAALSDYAQGEVQDTRPTSVHHHPSSSSSTSAAVASSSSAVAQPPMENLPPPPPPLPDFSPPPLQRSASMPDLPIPKSKKFAVDASIREEEDGDDELDDDDDDDRMDTARPIDTPPPPPQPQPQPQPTTKPPPPMPESKGMEWDYFFTMDENMPGPSLDPPEEIRPEIVAPPPPSKSAVIDDVPPITPEKVVLEPPKKQKQKQSSTVHHQHAASAGAAASSESKKGKMVAAPTRNVSLFQILSELDDHFLKASESAHEVSKMLEANRMHYHSNFADNRGHIDHSARVLRVITWNKSLKGIPNADDGKDDFDTDEWETHATVLDKLLAWEKKLYDEVKAGELMKIEYQRKVSLLNKQKKHGAKPETLEKTKAAVSHLHTRYIVDMQSMDSTVSEIQDLRDKRLYPKLVELVEGMAKMWETMHAHHGLQLRSVGDIRALDTSNAPKETSDQHHDRTIQLLRIVREWHSQFQKLVNHQKEYIQALNSWLRLNLIPIESSLKEKVSSPPRVLDPPIKALLHAWHDQLEKLPTDLARVAIFSFSEVIDTIVLQQQEELKQKEKCEEIYKEYQRKFRAFEDWKHKYSQRRAAAAQPEEEVVDQERSSEGANQKDSLAERGFVVEALKKRHEDEVELHQKLCKQVREKSLGSFKTHLPELFRSMTDFALSSSEMYKKLASISN